MCITRVLLGYWTVESYDGLGRILMRNPLGRQSVGRPRMKWEMGFEKERWGT
jgi:hypothetical protein